MISHFLVVLDFHPFGLILAATIGLFFSLHAALATGRLFVFRPERPASQFAHAKMQVDISAGGGYQVSKSQYEDGKPLHLL